MLEILRRYRLITLLLMFNFSAFADAPPLEALADNARMTAQVSKIDSASQETTTTKKWQLLLNLP